MQILENTIKYRWGALPDEQREGVKNYITNLIIKLSSDEAAFRREKTTLNKLNIILVQVLKQVRPPTCNSSQDTCLECWRPQWQQSGRMSGPSGKQQGPEGTHCVHSRGSGGVTSQWHPQAARGPEKLNSGLRDAGAQLGTSGGACWGGEILQA